MIAIPGKIVRCGAFLRYARPPESIAPHSGVGAFTPSPRKLNPEVERIADATFKDTYTMMGAIQLGIICERMISKLLAPIHFAASTNSWSFTVRTEARTIRA